MVKRYTHYALTILLSLWITSGTLHAKWFGLSKSADLQSPEIRALAIGLEDGLKDLEILDANLNSVGKLTLRQFTFSKAFTAPIIDGQLRFGAPDGVDKRGKPKFKLIASFDWKESYKQECLLFLPKSIMIDGAQGKAEYIIKHMDLSKRSFKQGETQIINLTPYKTIVKAGEHNVTVAPWDRSICSEIKDLSGVKMAQFEVSYLKEGTQHNTSQTRLRYLNTVRYITFIYVDAKREKVSVSIIKDFGNLFN